MDSKKACVFNIQKFSLHDGPGIRTIIFFKGCPLKCQWCANPESLSGNIQIAWDSGKCSHCLKCIAACPAGAIEERTGRIHVDNEKCNGCLICVNKCPQRALKAEGEFMAADDIVTEVLKDLEFYQESGGGVTLSGGEVLQQADFAIELLKKIRAVNIHAACETSGYSEPEVFDRFIMYIDLLLFDIKHYDFQKHMEGTGAGNDGIIRNLKKAVEVGRRVIVRIPVIPCYNDSAIDAEQFCKLLKEIGISEVNLLPFHQFGQRKYELLDMDYHLKDVKQINPKDIEEYRKIFLENGFDCYI